MLPSPQTTESALRFIVFRRRVAVPATLLSTLSPLHYCNTLKTRFKYYKSECRLCGLRGRQHVGLSLRWDFTQLRGVGRTCSCNTRIVCQLERAYIFSALEKKGAEYVLSTKEERQKKYRQSGGFILCDLQSLYLNCEKSLLHPFVIFLPHNVE